MRKMEKIRDFSQELVELSSRLIGEKVLITDTAGIIVGCSDEERIGDIESDLYEDGYEEDIDEPLVCPECGEEIDFDELGIDDTVKSFKCPECGTKIDIEWLDCDEDAEDAED